MYIKGIKLAICFPRAVSVPVSSVAPSSSSVVNALSIATTDGGSIAWLKNTCTE